MKTRPMIKTRYFRPFTALLLALGSASSALAQSSQSGSTEGWYQVHMAVFEHRGDAGEHDELWRNQLQLRYPPKLIRLKTREQFLADLCGISEPDPSVNASENRLLDILERVDAGEDYPTDSYENPTPAQPLDPACKERYPERFPASGAETAKARADATVASAREMVGDNTTAATSSALTTLTPYVLAPQVPDAEFAEMVKKLKGAYRYRMLFSGSWPQQLETRSKATPLLVQGGNQVGRHFELEGYVKLALERYLHIDTDLWLSRYNGQAQTGPGAYRSEPQTPRVNEFPALPTPFPVNDRDSAARLRQQRAAERYAQQQYADESFRDDNEMPRRPSSNLDILMAEDSSYYVERTVVMRQNRRMRSGEVHYLDHPLFGVLIKITPITAPKSNSDKTAALNR